MCQKLVSNVKFGIWSQKYGVGRNFEFWQKFLPLLLPTEHFPKKCRKMLKNAFFQNCQKSIVFSYFPWKLILKGVFRTKVRISTTEIWITFVKTKLSWFLSSPPKFDEKFSMLKTTMLFFWCACCVHIPYFGFRMSVTNLSWWYMLN